MNSALNAKGIILRAFEQFRLKSCVDFKPRGSEYHFISAQKNRGCSSHVGRSSKYGQPLSIGNYCYHIGIVEHEFLHALGIWHEQSRYDRDECHERNFVKVSHSTTLGFPYDYSSVLHDKKSISFMEHCNFDNQRLCGMSHGIFQVEFEVRKGAGLSTGGFSIDDINTPRYYSPEGYAYQIAFYLREMLFGVYVRLVSGKYDDQLQWPCHHRQVTIQLLDQNLHISITTEPSLQDGKRNSNIQYE
nr:meprin A subunit beta-like [Salvelinus alpinus]